MSNSELTTQTPAERSAGETELRALVVRFAPAHERLVNTLRRRLWKRLPTAHEVVYEYRDCFVISYSPSERGYEGVLAIRGSTEGVQLYFNQGKQLPDPEKLLQGSGKRVRFIPVEDAATLTRPAVTRLIEAAIANNPVPFAPTGRGPVVIRSTKARKRPRHAPPKS